MSPEVYTIADSPGDRHHSHTLAGEQPWGSGKGFADRCVICSLVGSRGFTCLSNFQRVTSSHILPFQAVWPEKRFNSEFSMKKLVALGFLPVILEPRLSSFRTEFGDKIMPGELDICWEDNLLKQISDSDTINRVCIFWTGLLTYTTWKGLSLFILALHSSWV